MAINETGVSVDWDASKSTAPGESSGSSSGSSSGGSSSGSSSSSSGSSSGSSSSSSSSTSTITIEIDQYGYVIGGFYLVGSAETIPEPYIFYRKTSEMYTLNRVKLKKGDVVYAARYNGGKSFSVYPDGVGQPYTAPADGEYDFYFKPYEVGNPNYWSFTGSVSPEAPAVLRGDYDGDGLITIMDATRVQHILAKNIAKPEESFLKAADADGDGVFTIVDATRIQNVLAKLIKMDGSPC